MTGRDALDAAREEIDRWDAQPGGAALAQYLRGLEVRGVKQSGGRCPLAQRLNHVLAQAGPEGRERYAYLMGGRVEVCPTGEYLPVLDVEMSVAVRDFVGRFDLGEYPDLAVDPGSAP